MAAENYLEIGNRLPYRKIRFRVYWQFSLLGLYPRDEGNCNWETKIDSRQFLARDIKVSLLAHWEGEPLQLKAFSTIKGALGSCHEGIRSPLWGHRFPLRGDPFRLRASFNCLIVSLGPGAVNCQGFGVSLRI